MFFFFLRQAKKHNKRYQSKNNCLKLLVRDKWKKFKQNACVCRSIMTDLYYLSQADGVGDWRVKEAKDLSDLVQNRITYLQVCTHMRVRAVERVRRALWIKVATRMPLVFPHYQKHAHQELCCTPLFKPQPAVRIQFLLEEQAIMVCGEVWGRGLDSHGSLRKYEISLKRKTKNLPGMENVNQYYGKLFKFAAICWQLPPCLCPENMKRSISRAKKKLCVAQ